MSHPMRMSLLGTAVTAVALLAAAAPALAVVASPEPSDSAAPMEPPEPMTDGIVIRDAWTRASMMIELANAAYMVIHNGTDQDDALVGASSPAATVTELHQSSMAEDGTMAMMPVTEIPVPAGGEAILEPGGYHIMLIDLVQELAEGDVIEITLQFRSAAPQTISVPVQAGPMGDGMGMGDDSGMGDGMGMGDDSGMGMGDDSDGEACAMCGGMQSHDPASEGEEDHGSDS